MTTIETKSKNGRQVVIATSQDNGQTWQSRLYLNGGETASLQHAEHRSEAGARKWAAKQIARFEK